jgi:hypothetical protein
MEEWKQIEDYPNYEVNNAGVIRTTKNEFTRKERILKIKKSNNGYVRVGLWKNNRVSFKSVHRLVAIYFIPNPDNLPEVNHLDGDKENCNDWNLEWSSHIDNSKHASETGLIASRERHGKTNLTSQDVKDIRASELKVTELCEKYNLHNTTIYSIKRGETWK